MIDVEKRREKIIMIIAIIYLALGYWATGKTTHANKIFIGYKMGGVFCERLAFALILGWILIPVAFIRTIFHI